MKKQKARVDNCIPKKKFAKQRRKLLNTRRAVVLQDASHGIPIKETAAKLGVHFNTVLKDRRFLVAETGEIDFKAYRQHLFDKLNEKFETAIDKGLDKVDAAWGNVFSRATGIAIDKTEHSGGIVIKTQEEIDAAREESIARVGNKAAKRK